MHICINEDRLRQLEKSEAVMGTKLDNLIKELDELTTALKGLFWVTIPIMLTAIGFLFTYWVKK